MTFKDLDFKKKLEHIWEYYKLTILGTLFIVIAGGSIAYAMLKPQPENYTGIAIYRPHITAEQQQELTNELNSSLNLTEMETVNISNYYFEQTDPIFNTEMEQKFVTYLFSLQLNIVTAMQQDLDLFIDSEYVSPLSEYYTDEQLAAWDEQGLLYYRTDPIDNQNKAFALNISSSALFNKHKVFRSYDEPSYLAIVPIKDYEAQTKAAIAQIIAQ